ncbi:hypothetical protein [Paraburkholderia strydomiana]|uniref:hypothetical protein n=1 Tax=Paraburkholderia strydomiana TaxID=1245417 RepID=UPI001BE82B27|nr:hypothetical protein [Paraburkholderia strydomiana]MBT2790139.1 hypothetical protein [Paraburkholderia strydomiana]
MHDRFDRRELLLHLGDMLEALSCLARTGAPHTPVVQLAKEEDLIRDLEFLGVLAPNMTVDDFSARVAGAFFLWPKKLLDTRLNRETLAATVQQELFDGNPDGWNAYVAHIQKKVKWFGAGLPEMKPNVPDERGHDTAEEVAPDGAMPSAGRRAPGERKGWPWPDPKTIR